MGWLDALTELFDLGAEGDALGGGSDYGFDFGGEGIDFGGGDYGFDFGGEGIDFDVAGDTSVPTDFGGWDAGDQGIDVGDIGGEVPEGYYGDGELTGDQSVYGEPETQYGDQELDNPSETVTGRPDPIAGPGVGSQDPTGGDKTGGPGGGRSTLERLLSSLGDRGLSALGDAATGALGGAKNAVSLFSPPDMPGISPLSVERSQPIPLPAAPQGRQFTPYTPEVTAGGGLERLLRSGRG